MTDKDIVTDALNGERGPTQRAIAEKGIEWIEVLLKKNQDYGSAVFKKPILCSHLYALDAILVRASDKIERIRNLNSKDAEVDESLLDTIGDLGGYCLLYLVGHDNESLLSDSNE